MNNKNANTPAFPTPPKQYSEEYRQRLIQQGYGDRSDFGFLYPGEGLTKREYFAIKVCNAILSNADTMRNITKKINSLEENEREAEFLRVVAKISVIHADALLEELEKTIPAKRFGYCRRQGFTTQK